MLVEILPNNLSMIMITSMVSNLIVVTLSSLAGMEFLVESHSVYPTNSHSVSGTSVHTWCHD